MDEGILVHRMDLRVRGMPWMPLEIAARARRSEYAYEKLAFGIQPTIKLP